MAWGISTVNTWYKNAAGHVTQNWPFTLLEYWERTREAGSRRLRVHRRPAGARTATEPPGR